MSDDVLSRIDFTDDMYTIKQSLVRNKYTVRDSAGDLVLKTKQKLFKMKEEFPFMDANGDTVFTVKAQSMLDFAGDYTITDAGTGEAVAVLSKRFTFLMHRWEVKDPDGNVMAVIRNQNKVVQALRSLVNIANLIPHSYAIEAADGQQVGEIKGHFSIRDMYTLTMDDTGDAPREALIAAAVAVDALEGN